MGKHHNNDTPPKPNLFKNLNSNNSYKRTTIVFILYPRKKPTFCDF